MLHDLDLNSCLSKLTAKINKIMYSTSNQDSYMYLTKK